MKYLIIGGVAGGATTVARLRRLDEKSQIVLFEKGAYISYANCGLPYYIGDVITERDKLFVQTAESFGTRFNLDVRVNTEVLKINAEAKTVRAKNLITGEEYEESFDKLVLSPGAAPVKPPLKGIDSKGIFTLRNVADTDSIKSYINENKPQRAVVVGAGFIGLEMAENLHHLGIKVSIVEMSEQVMTPLDFSMASIVHQHLKMKNVEFYLKEGVEAFENKNNQIEVSLKSGRKINVDLVILSIGVRPDARLAKEAGLQIGTTGGIFVNEYLQTSNSDIYAVGDAIEYPSPITEKPVITYLAAPANRQGRICADNIVLGNTTKYRGSIGTAIAKVFDITVASTGVAAKTLKREGIEYLHSITHSSSHAGYYPDAKPLTIKLIFAPKTGKLFGAQIVGYEGVDKRLDLIASVLKNNGTIYDLIDIEHAYAPPYSSAKDPVNIAGYAADNILTQRVKPIYWNEIATKKAFLIDVRTKDEFELGTIPSAINIPVDELRNNLNQIPKNQDVIVFCAVGLRGYLASRILTQNGFEQIYNLSGGYKTWETAIQKQSNEDIYEDLVIKKDDQLYQNTASKTASATLKIDACGLQCPGPIMKMKNTMETVSIGDIIEVSATDAGFAKDVVSWSNMTGNKVLSVNLENGKITAQVQKGKAEPANQKIGISGSNAKTFVVFSDDLDKVLASFVIANGAASTGKKVTMFFTFWGLNVIKKKHKPAVKKDFLAKMFGMMMPSSVSGLKLSKLHMMGIGTRLMRYIMRKKSVDSLEQFLQMAIDNGVEMIACQMSMDVMGVKREELLDTVQIGGVAAYLEKAEDANMNLFI